MPIVSKLDPDEVEHLVQFTPRPLSMDEREALLATLKDRSGISRIDSKRTHGWLTRIYPPGQPAYGKHFSDGTYGSASGALAAAVVWRDEERRNLPPRPQKLRIWRLNTPRQRGHLAQRDDGTRRYFSDARNDGEAGSYQAAYDWIAEGREQSNEVSA